jgi:hypothetical protein
MHLGARAVIFIVIVGILVPIPQAFVGEWTVRVSDYDNRPISGARVKQVWENYTYNVSGEQDLKTDAEGKVVFAPQRKYGPLIYWVVKAIANVLGYGVHAGFGTVGRVWVAEIGSLDPERRERLAQDQKVLDALASNCGTAGCGAKTIESHLHIPSP